MNYKEGWFSKKNLYGVGYLRSCRIATRWVRGQSQVWWVGRLPHFYFPRRSRQLACRARASAMLMIRSHRVDVLTKHRDFLCCLFELGFGIFHPTVSICCLHQKETPGWLILLSIHADIEK
jgi:hypothetical protein